MGDIVHEGCSACIVLDAWCCVVLRGAAWCCVVLCGAVWCCVVLCIAACTLLDVLDVLCKCLYPYILGVMYEAVSVYSKRGKGRRRGEEGGHTGMCKPFTERDSESYTTKPYLLYPMCHQVRYHHWDCSSFPFWLLS